MDIFKEFLESSTVHGLVYLSTSKTLIQRGLWGLIIAIAFSIALKLISNSYIEWNNNPVSTSVSTHPIQDLDFPNVTICPPKGYDTALNYDLVQTGKLVLTENDRKGTILAAKNAFLIDSHKDFTNLMLAVTNPSNIDAINSGLQMAPSPYSQDGFEVTSWASSGSLSSPWFGKQLGSEGGPDQLFYKTNHSYHYILDLSQIPPEEVAEKNLNLVINIEVITRKNKKWKEVVKISKGAKKTFKYYSEEKKWDKIEKYCTEQLGQFASILNEEEQRGAEAVLPTQSVNDKNPTVSWIGGEIGSNCDLTWADQAPVTGFTNFEEQCTVSTSSSGGSRKTRSLKGDSDASENIENSNTASSSEIL